MSRVVEGSVAITSTTSSTAMSRMRLCSSITGSGQNSPQASSWLCGTVSLTSDIVGSCFKNGSSQWLQRAGLGLRIEGDADVAALQLATQHRHLLREGVDHVAVVGALARGKLFQNGRQGILGQLLPWNIHAATVTVCRRSHSRSVARLRGWPSATRTETASGRPAARATRWRWRGRYSPYDRGIRDPTASASP